MLEWNWIGVSEKANQWMQPSSLIKQIPILKNGGTNSFSWKVEQLGKKKREPKKKRGFLKGKCSKKNNLLQKEMREKIIIKLKKRRAKWIENRQMLKLKLEKIKCEINAINACKECR